MDKKKLRSYILIFCIAVLISVYLPYLIDLGSSKLVDGLDTETEQTEAATESGPGYAETLGGRDVSETENDDGDVRPKEDKAREEAKQNPSASSGSDRLPVTDEEVQKQKEEQDEGLQRFRQSFHPEITEAYSGVQEAFIGDRAVEFDHAISDHFYQAYGDLYTVTKVELKEMLDETDDEIRCMVRVFTKSGEKTYSQDYIVVYSKAYDFYSVYAYNR
ncbi:hypothetical protein [Porcincola intestinalis]|uniref:Uncharacterized protein n=1 Tax=Porcincola intestinalis TaxID=2606632 RepID=A0A6L5X4T3_9FIRM|nr:hypothetical protein [Porcincola intestinalis]MCI6697851.1 hypothetical protein [Lachnospiraceae bacterium]MSS13864.1 hypothetical protein [Porcincola intestinalis]